MGLKEPYGWGVRAVPCSRQIPKALSRHHLVRKGGGEASSWSGMSTVDMRGGTCFKLATYSTPRHNCGISAKGRQREARRIEEATVKRAIGHAQPTSAVLASCHLAAQIDES